ncbi:hypothetical protein CROQUDRAFT_658654 [Cronartium quercuum f. sp. fusiforme G11]|uniref:Uncharacterized protein n=1 Tax=Cronartium quercuum f. sp. fusiforme G11 TaxID=708437 RepID=A0A9P6NL06_9BASI|nr:hypothetical protein CROQUDRAFT_658654 [Cronartium quercuum f. sp. fusiforme G11]
MHCSIGWVSAYLAGRNLKMNTEEQYQEWASKALLFGSNNQKPACAWKMEKPDDPAVIAAWEAGVAKMMQMMPRLLNDGQPAPRGVMDVRYNRHTKVYLIPDDLTQHVLLLARNMQTWAHGVVDPDQPGMTEDSPPSSMCLKTSEQHQPKHQRILAVGFDVPDINEGPITPRSTPECQTKCLSGGILEYIQFSGLPNPHSIAEMFQSKSIINCKCFGPTGSAREEHILALGYEVGVWMSLKDFFADCQP